MNYGLVMDSDFLKHQVPPDSPERPARLKAISQKLSKHPNFDQLVTISPTVATEKAILRVHSQDHVMALQQTRGPQTVLNLGRYC